MPNIRIKDIPTTASATSSTDFIGIDGSANGTRKLNAYSPTFGGNLTVSGTGGVSTIRGAQSSQNAVLTLQNNGSGNDFSGLILDVSQIGPNANSRRWLISSNYQNYGTLDIQRSTTNSGAPTTVVASFDSSSNLTLSGNLTVSGTGTSSVAGNLFVGTTTAAASGARLQAQLTGTDGTVSTLLSLRKNTNAIGTGVAIDFIPESTDVPLAKLSAVRTNVNNGYTDFRFSTWNGSALVEQLRLVGETGNLIIGSSFTDGGQKLQVSGNSGFLGHLEIPADKHIYMKQGNPLRWSSDGLSTGTVRADIYADSGGILYFRSNGTTAALNIDASQNATFAGSATVTGRVNVVNATSYLSADSSNLIYETYAGKGHQFKTAGTTALTITNTQVATFAAGVDVGAASYLAFTNRSAIRSSADGLIRLTNWSDTDFARLQFGGTTASFPALKRVNAVLTCVLADDSAFATFRALDFSAQGAATTVGANQVSYGGTTATTATAGAQTLPANPVGFIIVNVAGTTAKIPYYAN